MNNFIFDILFTIMPILVVGVFAFSLVMIFSPKFRGKILSRNIKAQKHMFDYAKEDLEDMITTVSNIGINSKKKIYDENEDVIEDLAIKEANIQGKGIKIKARAIKEGLMGEDIMYCKHCGESIDVDSKFCKKCGKKQ